jgi:mannose-6-phosphate isomerase-like protein (cupin superfamily)/GNAT superfamily N-acetyltransferase
MGAEGTAAVGIVGLDHRDPGVAGRLVGLQRASYAVEAELIGFDGIPPLHEPVEALMTTELVWLGVLDGSQLAAAVAYRRVGGTVDLDRLVVAPWAFRRGYGRVLVATVLEREPGAGRFTVSTGAANRPARRLYEGLGFRPVRDREVAPGVAVTEMELVRAGRAPGPQRQREAHVAKVNLDRQFGRFDELWSPKIVASVNDYDVKLVKLQGEFLWHQHDDTDELFLVTDGELRIRLEDADDVVLGPGELFVVPRGTRHCPVAERTTRVVLLEPAGTPNTGDADRPGTTGERLG